MTTRSAEHGTFTISAPTPSRQSASSPPGPARSPRRAGSAPAPATSSTSGSAASEINRGGPPGGPVFTLKATYEDIVPDERIVYGYVMDADGALISVSVTTVEFAAAGSGTTLTFTEQGVFLDGADTPASARRAPANCSMRSVRRWPEPGCAAGRTGHVQAARRCRAGSEDRDPRCRGQRAHRDVCRWNRT